MISTSLPAPRNILIIQPVKLGDVLVTTPLLDDLHAAFPEAALDFAVAPAGAILLQNNPLIRRVIVLTGRLLTDAREIRRVRYDWCFDPRGTAGTVLFSLLSGARVRAGFAVRLPRRLAFTHRLSQTGRPPEFVANERRRLLAMLGVPTSSSPPRLYLTDAERAAAAERFRALDLPRGRPVIGMSLTAGTRRRDWGAERWAQVSRQLADLGCAPVVFSGQGEDHLLSAFVDAGGRAMVLSCGLRELLPLLEFCRVFLSADSGPAHFAATLGVSTVTIYSRGQGAHWNHGKSDTILLEAPADVLCPECELPRGAIDRAHHTCVRSVTPATVTAAAASLLETSPAGRT
ncbi:MAG: glycosyltransferase family 9 protein [Gemmatimonadota bacterium]